MRRNKSCKQGKKAKQQQQNEQQQQKQQQTKQTESIESKGKTWGDRGLKTVGIYNFIHNIIGDIGSFFDNLDI